MLTNAFSSVGALRSRANSKDCRALFAFARRLQHGAGLRLQGGSEPRWLSV